MTSAGLDRVPLDYCKAHGITVYNAGGVYSAPMAEFVLGGILQLYKESKFFAENQAAHRWEKHRGLRELSGKTACIIGTGSVGSAIARRLRAFDVQTVGMNRSGHPAAEFDQTQPTCRLDDLLPLADLVICAMPRRCVCECGSRKGDRSAGAGGSAAKRAAVRRGAGCI